MVDSENKKGFMWIKSDNKNYPKPLEEKSKSEIYSEIHSTRLEMHSIRTNLHHYMIEVKTMDSVIEKNRIFNKINDNIQKFVMLKNYEKLLEERLKTLFFFEEEELKSVVKKIFNQHFCEREHLEVFFSFEEDVLKNNIKKVFNKHFYECRHLEDVFKNEILENLKYHLNNLTTDYESLIQDWVKLFQKQNKQQYSQCTLETVFCKRILVKLLPKEPKLLRIFVMQEDTDVAPVEKEVDEVFTSEGGGNF